MTHILDMGFGAEIYERGMYDVNTKDDHTIEALEEMRKTTRFLDTSGFMKVRFVYGATIP